MRTMSWDWKEQPDFAELSRLVTEVAGKPIKIRKIETGTDLYVIAISSGSAALELGDVVAVLTHNGEVGYFGEVTSLPVPGSDAALFDRGKVGVWNPETDEVHSVASADGEGIREATEAESDAYIERWLDSDPEPRP